MERETTKKRLSARAWVMIGGGAAVGLLLLVLLAGTASVDSLRFLGLDTLKANTLARLDLEVSPALREELRRGFDCVIRGVTAGTIDAERVGGFARACRRAFADGHVTKAEAETLRDLTRSICARS